MTQKVSNPQPWSRDQVHLVRGQIAPRLRGVLLQLRVLIASVLGLLLAVAAPRLPLKDVAVSELAGAGLAYAGLSVSACLTGAVLAISLPSQQARTWAVTPTQPGGRFSHYSELIFNFVWSGLLQLAVAAMAVAGYVFGGNQNVLPPDPWPINYLWIGLAFSLFVYALTQLLTIFATVAQVGHVLIVQYNADLRRDRALPVDSESAGYPDG